MATFPVYQQGQVSQSRAPSFAIQTEVPIEAVGGGRSAERKFNAISNVGETIANIYLLEREKGRDIATAEYAAKMSAEVTARQIAISKRRGKDALDGVEEGLADFDKYYQSLDSEIQDQEVRRRVNGLYLQSRDNINAWGQPYAARELRAYDEIITKQGIRAEQDAVKTDGSQARIAQAIFRQEEYIKGHAMREGFGEKWADNEFKRARSLTHRNVIESRLEARDYNGAQKYFDSIENQLLGDDRPQTLSQLQKAGIEDRAGKAVSDVSGFVSLTNADGYSEALKAINGIEDEKVKASALIKLRQARADQLTLETQQREAIYESLVKSVESMPGRALTESLTIPQQEAFHSLPSEMRDAIKKRAQALEKIDMTDEALLHYLNYQGLDDSQIALLEPNEIHVLISEFDKEHREKAISRWGAARKGGGGSALNSMIKDYKMNKLKILEIIPPDGKMELEDIQQIARFDKRVDIALNRFPETHNGKLPNDTELKLIIDEAASQTLPIYGSKVPISSLTEKIIASITGPLGRADVMGAIKKIPDPDIERIKGEILASKRKVTDEKVVRIYRAVQIGDEELVERILTERDE